MHYSFPVRKSHSAHILQKLQDEFQKEKKN